MKVYVVIELDTNPLGASAYSEVFANKELAEKYVKEHYYGQSLFHVEEKVIRKD